VIAAVLYQTGKFTHTDAIYVWAILAGSTVGLLASTLGRLYSSTYYALRDTRTPLRYAIIRVTLTTVLGYLFALPLPRAIGLDPKWGVAGLTASAGIAGCSSETHAEPPDWSNRIVSCIRNQALDRSSVGSGYWLDI
jgi:putative peptidoglycan lipid II flippase